MPSLEVLVATTLVVSLMFYVLFAGADFGAGVWYLLADDIRGRAQRHQIEHAIGPIWEANHVWLILAVVLLFTAFPPAFGRVMTVLHIPLFLLLLSIVARGSAFAIRSHDVRADPMHGMWGWMFAVSSMCAPVLLGGVALLAGAMWLSVWRHWPRLARLFAAAEVIVMMAGWALGQDPYLVRPDLTIYNTAAPEETLRFLLGALLAGAVILFPSLYYLYGVFKGGMRGQPYKSVL